MYSILEIIQRPIDHLKTLSLAHYEYIRQIMASRRGIGTSSIVTIVVGFFLFAILAPIALAQMESYTPADPVLLIVWPLAGILFVIGMAIKYVPGGGD